MKRTLSTVLTAAAALALATFTALPQQAAPADSRKFTAGACQNLPSAGQLRQLLIQAQNVNKPIGGLFEGTRMWAAVVNRDGEVCAFTTSTSDPTQVWPGSQAIAKSKAYAANAFSLDDFALSTARLYTFTQPGHSLWSLGQSNLFNPEFLAGPGGQSGGKNQLVGGLIFFGGGVPLYRNGKIVGGWESAATRRAPTTRSPSGCGTSGVSTHRFRAAHWPMTSSTRHPIRRRSSRIQSARTPTGTALRLAMRPRRLTRLCRPCREAGPGESSVEQKIVQDSIREYGLIYCEEVVSPDGTVKVIYGYNDGEKTPVTVEPRIIEVSTGEVLVDLWRAWCQGAVEFVGPGKLRIQVHDAYHRVLICQAEIDVKERQFALVQTPHLREPLTAVRNRVLELAGY